MSTPSDIARYELQQTYMGGSLDRDNWGDWVRYDDHLADKAAARAADAARIGDLEREIERAHREVGNNVFFTDPDTGGDASVSQRVEWLRRGRERDCEARADAAEEIERLKDLISRYESDAVQHTIDLAAALSKSLQLTTDITTKAEAAAKAIDEEVMLISSGDIPKVAEIITREFTQEAHP